MAYIGTFLYVLATLFVLSSQQAFARKLTPQPSDVAAWLHSRCSHQKIFGERQRIASKISACLRKDGQNEVEWIYFFRGSHPPYCRKGVDCPNDIDIKRAAMFVKEKYNCRDGLLDGPYEASVKHRFQSNSIFGSLVVAEFKSGKLHGTSHHSSLKGSVCRVHEYKNGKLHGVSRVYTDHRRGLVKQEAEFRHGLQNGFSKTFDRSGRLMSSINYKDGIKDGKAEYYDNDGTKTAENWFQKDQLVKSVKYLPNGQTVTKDKAQIEKERQKARSDLQRRQHKRSFWKKSDLGLLGGLRYGYLDSHSDSFEDYGSIAGISGYIGVVDCKDIACGGYTLALEVASTSRGRTVQGVELGAGVIAMYLTLYGGIGVRKDGDELGPQVTVMAGFFFVQVYTKLYKLDSSRKLGNELGLSVVIPIVY